MKTILGSIAVFAFLLASPSVALACAVRMGTPTSWLADSAAIVRVRPLEERRSPDAWGPGPWGPGTTVRFEVVEVLKGQVAPVLEFEGELTDLDDPNPLPVPYSTARSMARGSYCFTFTYKRDGEYLLILGSRNDVRPLRGSDSKGGGLTPYWAPMGATNEQLFGANDPWLAWVRAQLVAGQR